MGIKTVLDYPRYFTLLMFEMNHIFQKIVPLRYTHFAFRVPNYSRSRSSHSFVVRAMINFDSGPAQILGASVMVGSCLLYSTRMNNAKITKDGDVVVSSVGILVGGI